MKNFKIKTYWSVILMVICSNTIAGQKTGEVEISSPLESKKFILPKTDKTGESKDKYIASILDKAINKNIFRNGRTYNFGLSSHVLGQTSVSYNGQKDSLEYSWSWEQSLNHNVVTAHFDIITEEKDDGYEVTLKCPDKLVLKVRDLSLFGIPQWNLSNIAADVSYACLNAN